MTAAHKATKKVAKWLRKAEEATTREQAAKALRKFNKWNGRLQQVYTLNSIYEDS